RSSLYVAVLLLARALFLCPPQPPPTPTLLPYTTLFRSSMIFCALPAVSPTVTLSWAVQIVSVIPDVPDISNDYVTRVLRAPSEADASAWDSLLALSGVSPFMRHAYLAALHDSGSAAPDTGWLPQFLTLWQGEELHAACPLYVKSHSYGEYVFDWAW